MSFARQRTTPTSSLTNHIQRQIQRQIEERCTENKAAQLGAIKTSAAPKIDVHQGDKESRAYVKAHRTQHQHKLREEEETLRQANRADEAHLCSIDARTTFDLRRSVTERGIALHEQIAAKRHAEAAKEAKDKRKLAKLVQKAQPRTEVALPDAVLAGQAALEQDKKRKQASANKELVAANKAATRRLRDVARAHTFCGAIADHAAAHEERRQAMDKHAAEKRQQMHRAAKLHRKELERLAAAARPKTLVSLSDAHGQKLSELTRLSEQKAKAERLEQRQHEAKLSALTAGSARKIELPPLEHAKAARADAAERRAATVIQAARRGSIGRSEADAARRALARMSALTPGDRSEPLAGAALRSDKPSPSRPSIGQGTVARAETWLAAQSRLTQRRDAITPTEQQVVAKAATAAAAAA